MQWSGSRSCFSLCNVDFSPVHLFSWINAWPKEGKEIRHQRYLWNNANNRIIFHPVLSSPSAAWIDIILVLFIFCIVNCNFTNTAVRPFLEFHYWIVTFVCSLCCNREENVLHTQQWSLMLSYRVLHGWNLIRSIVASLTEI